MCKKDIILLDARLKDVIDIRAFHAELSNGHRFVAFLQENDAEKSTCHVGEQVKVQMSPFDMSRGKIVLL